MSETREYRLHDYRTCLFSKNVATFDIDKLIESRENIWCLQKPLSDDDRIKLSWLNCIIRTLQLYHKPNSEYSEGFRKYRERTIISNFIITTKHIIILSYAPNGSCDAHIYLKDSNIGTLWLEKFSSFDYGVLDDNQIVINESVMHVDDEFEYIYKTITLPIVK